MPTALHTNLQRYLYQNLGPKNVVLELPFPSIRRIADVFFSPANLILEVQCSPLLPIHLQERTMDYRWAGKEILWLLWEQAFSKHQSHFSLFTPYLLFRQENDAFRFFHPNQEPIPLIPRLLQFIATPFSRLEQPAQLPFSFCSFLTCIPK